MERSLLDEANGAGVQFLLTDASVALTFLSVAETAADQETRERNIGNARTAFDTIQRLRVRLHLTDPQREDLDSKLRELKSRAEALGASFQLV